MTRTYRYEVMDTAAETAKANGAQQKEDHEFTTTFLLGSLVCSLKMKRVTQ